MKCPVDNSPLQISDRQGVEIDYCPTCRGVWLDRGELDKLIERSQQYEGQRDNYHREEHQDRRDERQYRHDDDDHHNDRRYHEKKHKKESFLGDMFDF